MTQPSALSVHVKTAYLLWRVGSDHLMVTSFPSWNAAPPLCPARVSGQEASLTYCVSPRHPIHPSSLSLWASISPSCNHSATRNVKMPICVPEACKHHCPASETLKIISVLGEKEKAAKAASESQSPDKNMQFSQGHSKSTSLAHVGTA